MTDDKAGIGQVQIALRISPDLRSRIKDAAERNNRSVNSELTAALEERYPAPTYGDHEIERVVQEALAAAGITDPKDPRSKEIATNAILAHIDLVLEDLAHTQPG